MEVIGNKVEGAVLVVQLRPTLKEPGAIRSGAEDLVALAQEMVDAEEKKHASRREIEKLKLEAKQQDALRQRQALWRESGGERAEGAPRT